ncbi:unnamed protein product, partial [Polarella glacialis]
SDGSDKSTQDVIAWIRTLPENHVPEKVREELVCVVEQERMDGNRFSEYVLTVPPELCPPRNALKLKAGWKNVLAEAAHSVICRANLDYAAAQPKKAVAMNC